MSEYYFAVHMGRTPGIYGSWIECKAQTDGFPKANFKKFKSYDDALYFMRTGESASPSGDNRACGDSIRIEYGGRVAVLSIGDELARRLENIGVLPLH